MPTKIPKPYVFFCLPYFLLTCHDAIIIIIIYSPRFCRLFWCCVILWLYLLPPVIFLRNNRTLLLGAGIVSHRNASHRIRVTIMRGYEKTTMTVTVTCTDNEDSKTAIKGIKKLWLWKNWWHVLAGWLLSLGYWLLTGFWEVAMIDLTFWFQLWSSAKRKVITIDMIHLLWFITSPLLFHESFNSFLIIDFYRTISKPWQQFFLLVVSMMTWWYEKQQYAGTTIHFSV